MKKLNNNDYIALENILLGNNMSKTELSKILNISSPAVHKIIKKLNEKKLLSNETFLLKPKGGRPRSTIHINKKFKKLVGLFLNNNYIITTISYLDGEIIETKVRKRTYKLVQAQFIKMMVDEIEDVIDKYGSKDIAGIGISIPGLVDDVKGLVKFSPLFKSTNLKINEYIEDTFNIPCVIDNDVRSIMKAEKIMGCLKHTNNAILICLNTELGSSLIINNHIHSGINFAAGQFKNITITSNISIGEYCSYNNIVDRINKKLKTELDNPEIEYIINEANKGNTAFKEVMEDIGQKIGIAINNICQVLDIGNIVLTGAYIEDNECLINKIHNTINEANYFNNIKPNIIISKLKNESEALGSIALIMGNLFSGKKIIK